MSQGVLNALPQVLDIARDENGSTEVGLFVVHWRLLLWLICLGTLDRCMLELILSLVM